MIDACTAIRRFAPSPAEHRGSTTPLLRWVEDWRSSAGCGVIAGLLDSGFDDHIIDLVQADLVVRDFAGCGRTNPELAEHGTHSVTVLIGQGNRQIRGIAPRTRLYAASVVGADGVATPRAVAEAIDWLLSSGARIIVVPLGDAVEREEISQQIEKASTENAVFFAAAGNGYPDPLVFPARHPLAIAVGAADACGTLLLECSRWPRLDVVAPGWGIPAPVRGRVIRRRRGTSVACVIAAGVAILALSTGAISARSMCRMEVLATLRRGGTG